MSINISELKYGDKVTFAKSVTKTVCRVHRDVFGRIESVTFERDTPLAEDESDLSLFRTDKLWELAELQEPAPELPFVLCLAHLRDGHYKVNGYPSVSPGYFLSMLKSDVRDLERSGVKAEW